MSDLMTDLVEAVRAARAAVDQLDEAACQALGINRTDGRCLDVLDREGPVTAGRLAQQAGLSAAAATTAIDRLEAKGYVQRSRDANDRRRVLVALTPLARQRTRRIWGPLAATRGDLERYTADELELLIDFHRQNRQADEQRAAQVRALRFDEHVDSAARG
jgi:DNA-binding MarR family transcriptional regulator